MQQNSINLEQERKILSFPNLDTVANLHGIENEGECMRTTSLKDRFK